MNNSRIHLKKAILYTLHILNSSGKNESITLFLTGKVIIIYDELKRKINKWNTTHWWKQSAI